MPTWWCAQGAELEVAWLPVLAASGRQPQSATMASRATSKRPDSVRMLDVPTRLDRADGDVHAEGNPHIQTDPRNMALVAVSLAHRLSQIDPAQRPKL
jgi:zinc/manganese transport system substrate-binding protein